MTEFTGFEVLLQESMEGSLTEWVHFVSKDTPDYMLEHWQNVYEAQENQEYFVDVGSYGDRL